MLADALSELVGKQEFCEQSAIIIIKVLQGTVPYHSYTNEIIAELLNYIDYRYEGNFSLFSYCHCKFRLIYRQIGRQLHSTESFLLPYFHLTFGTA